MTEKVKRGLGLIVLAPLLWLVATVIDSAGTRGEGIWIFKELGLMAAALSVTCGLVLIAWGLLRD